MLHLEGREKHVAGAACRIRTDDLPLTSLKIYVFISVDWYSDIYC
jgi:hypothetical protein